VLCASPKIDCQLNASMKSMAHSCTEILDGCQAEDISFSLNDTGSVFSSKVLGHLYIQTYKWKRTPL